MKKWDFTSNFCKGNTTKERLIMISTRHLNTLQALIATQR
jgi:hypothetical protein